MPEDQHTPCDLEADNILGSARDLSRDQPSNVDPEPGESAPSSVQRGDGDHGPGFGKSDPSSMHPGTDPLDHRSDDGGSFHAMSGVSIGLSVRFNRPRIGF
jgi:hypothetical protein